MIYFVLGLFCIFGAAGGIETLPAEASVIDWLQPIMVFVLGVMLGLFGIDKIRGTV